LARIFLGRITGICFSAKSAESAEFLAISCQAGIIYVDAGASGGNNGSCRTNANNTVNDGK